MVLRDVSNPAPDGRKEGEVEEKGREGGRGGIPAVACAVVRGASEPAQITWFCVISVTPAPEPTGSYVNSTVSSSNAYALSHDSYTPAANVEPAPGITKRAVKRARN